MHPNDPNISPNVFLCALKWALSYRLVDGVFCERLCVIVDTVPDSSAAASKMFRYYSFAVNFYVANDDDTLSRSFCGCSTAALLIKSNLRLALACEYFCDVAFASLQ